ncbi:MAG: hypothetical protein M1814_000947 [Vezdaea aestivalis]|nr:MAG: hypothetical protein M1814_000947 [Vezdaea aestivalis]
MEGLRTSQYSKTTHSGPQQASFSYFHFNPEVHTREKPYEILINKMSVGSSATNYRRTNEEFEERGLSVEDVRGREHEFTLDGNGFCWRKWDAPKEWMNVQATELRERGNEWVKEGYIKEAEEFIKREVENMDGKTNGGVKKIDFVKVFDYRLRSSGVIDGFNERRLDLNDGLDMLKPITQPHVDQSFDGARLKVKEYMGERSEQLQKRRFRIVK